MRKILAIFATIAILVANTTPHVSAGLTFLVQNDIAEIPNDLLVNGSSEFGDDPGDVNAFVGSIDAQNGISNSTGDLTINDNSVTTGTSDNRGNIFDSLGTLTLDDATAITGTLDAQGAISDSNSDLTLNDNTTTTGTATFEGNTTVSDATFTVSTTGGVTGLVLTGTLNMTVTAGPGGPTNTESCSLTRSPGSLPPDPQYIDYSCTGGSVGNYEVWDGLSLGIPGNISLYFIGIGDQGDTANWNTTASGTTTVEGGDVSASGTISGTDGTYTGGMVIDSNGDGDTLRIGAASLTLAETTITQSSTDLNIKTNGDSDDYLILKTTSDVPVIATAGGSDLSLEPASGKIGIGTASPDAKLDIEAAEDTEHIRLTDSTNLDSAGIYIGNGAPTISAQAGSLFLDEAGTVHVNTSGSTTWLDLGAGGTPDAVWDADTNTGMQVEEGADDNTIRFDIESLGEVWNISSSGHILPSADDTYDIGSDSYRVRDLYLGSETIHIGDTVTTDEYTLGYNTTNNALVFNEAGGSFDLRAEGDTDANLLFVDASTDRVGLGTSAPQTKLTVGDVSAGTGEATYNGLIQIQGGSDITSGDNGLEFKAAAGTGYGWIISSPDRLSGNVPLVFGYRNNASAWTELMTMRSDTGRVGIGTATPNNKFEVADYIDFNASYTGQTAIGYQALNSNTGAYNTAVGYQAADSNTSGTYNTAIGYAAGHASTLTDYATAIGANALQASTVGFNTAVGANALFTNSTGANNVGFGYMAGYFNSVGSNNALFGTQAGRGASLDSMSYVTALGSFAGYSNQADNTTAVGYAAANYNTTGNYNTAVGYNALYNNATGSYNTALGHLAANGVASDQIANTTAIGYRALAGTTSDGNTAVGKDAGVAVGSGAYNTFIGNVAGNSTTSGNYNTAVGSNAGTSNTTGGTNTYIGYNANPSANNYDNAIAIGYSASVNASNKAVIGNSSVTTVGGYGNWSNYSDRSEKENIADYDTVGLSFINKLRPIEYNYIYQPGNTSHGFVAQEVEAALGDLNIEFSGVKPPQNETDHYMISYGQFTVPLTKAVQDLDLKFGNTLKPDSEGNVKIGLTAPQSVASVANEGGSLSAGTYYYAVAAVNGSTESALSEEVKTGLDGNPMKTVDVRWAPVAGATSYKIFKGTSSGNYTQYFTTTNTKFSDVGSTATSGTPNASTDPESIRLSVGDDSWITGGNVGIGTKTPDAPLAVAGDIKSYGNSFYLDSDNSGAGASVDIIAMQGTDSPGKIRYDATDDQWKISNNGGSFTAIPVAQVFDGYDNAGNTSVTTTESILNIDATNVADGAYTLSSDAVTINKDGLYKIAGRITVDSLNQSGDAQSSVVLRAEKNTGSGFADIAGALCQDLMVEDNAAGTTSASCALSIFQNLLNGNIIRLTHQMSGTTTAQTVPQGSGLTIELVR